MKCPVCNREMYVLKDENRRDVNICGFCRDYHDPEKCEGTGCKLCEEIRIYRRKD